MENSEKVGALKRLVLSEIYLHENKRKRLSGTDDEDANKTGEAFEVFHIYELHEDKTKIKPKFATNCTDPDKIIGALLNTMGSSTGQVQRLINKLCEQNRKEQVEKESIKTQLNTTVTAKSNRRDHAYAAKVQRQQNNSVPLEIPLATATGVVTNGATSWVVNVEHSNQAEPFHLSIQFPPDSDAEPSVAVEIEPKTPTLTDIYENIHANIKCKDEPKSAPNIAQSAQEICQEETEEDDLYVLLDVTDNDNSSMTAKLPIKPMEQPEAPIQAHTKNLLPQINQIYGGVNEEFVKNLVMESSSGDLNFIEATDNCNAKDTSKNGTSTSHGIFQHQSSTENEYDAHQSVEDKTYGNEFSNRNKKFNDAGVSPLLDKLLSEIPRNKTYSRISKLPPKPVPEPSTEVPNDTVNILNTTMRLAPDSTITFQIEHSSSRKKSIKIDEVTGLLNGHIQVETRYLNKPYHKAVAARTSPNRTSQDISATQVINLIDDDSHVKPVDTKEETEDSDTEIDLIEVIETAEDDIIIQGEETNGNNEIQKSSSNEVSFVNLEKDECADYRCNVCLQFNEDLGKYKEHMFRTHDLAYVCDTCHEAFALRNIYDNHVWVDDCKDRVNASRNYISIIDPPVILTKQGKVHAYKCKHCRFAFFNQRNYCQHAQRHAVLFRCKLCRDLSPLTVKAMLTHLETHRDRVKKTQVNNNKK